MTVTEIIVSVLVLIAALLVVGTAVAVWRAPDALTRVNILGPTVGVAIPLLLIAKLIYDIGTVGFSPMDLIRMLLAIAAVWIIGSVGSFYIGRAIYGVTVVDPGSAPDDSCPEHPEH